MQENQSPVINKELYDGLPFSVVLIDDDYFIRELNPSAALLAGSNLEDLKGKKCYAALFQQEHPCRFCPRANQLFTLDELHSSGFRFRQEILAEKPETPIPRNLYYDQTQYLVRNSDGRAFLAETLRDITQDKEQEEEKARNEKLILLGTIVQMVAHELNNPLTGLSMTLQTMEDADEEKIIRMRRDIELAQGIVADIQGFTRREGYRLEPIPLATILNESIDVAKRLFSPVPEFQITWDIPDKHIQIEGNEKKILQLFGNLFKNSVEAWKSSRREKPLTIWVIVSQATRKTDMRSTRHYLDIQIVDDAGGIPQEVLHRIFDPFFTTKKLYNRGSGLGLFIVHKIMEEHAGTVDVQTRGEFSRFILHFPLKRKV